MACRWPPSCSGLLWPFFVCVRMRGGGGVVSDFSCSYKDTSYNKLRPTFMSSFKLYLLIGPVSKYSHNGGYGFKILI